MEKAFSAAGYSYHSFQAMSVEKIEFLLTVNCSPLEALAVACLIDDETPFLRLNHFKN
jgi:hypothetical protein